MHSTTLPFHADGSLDVDALLRLHIDSFGSMRMEESDDGGDAAAAKAAADAKTAADAKAAADAAAAYQPPATQAELDRIIQNRVRKFADYDEIKAKADKHDALEAELGTAADKAAAEARKEEREKAARENVPRVVRAEFRAAAKGVLTDEQLSALLEDLDMSKYVTDKGDVDDEKVTKKVAAFAPTGTTTRAVSLGQGNQQQAQPKPGDRGRAAAEKRFGDKARSAVASGS